MPFDPIDHELRYRAIEKIGQVIALLEAEERWCKHRLKTADGRMCILGAVREADGELLLYAPILRAIREVTGHGYRQIEHFNDSWIASHELVLDVLERARHDLMFGAAAAPSPAHPHRPGPGGGLMRLWHRLAAGLRRARA